MGSGAVFDNKLSQVSRVGFVMYKQTLQKQKVGECQFEDLLTSSRLKYCNGIKTRPIEIFITS